MATITEIWRHPIKAHGREAVNTAALTIGQTLPWDRQWAVAHDASDVDGSTWASCQNFSRSSKAPALMAITCELDEVSETLTLHHPDRPDLTFQPDQDDTAFIDWVTPLMPANRAQSTRLVRATQRGMTDSDYPSISLCNMASHRAVSQKLGRDLSIHRWRGNIWLEELAPWEEFDWIGKHIRLGTAVLEVKERVVRCMATTANPETGLRDADTLGVLKTWGHQEFNVYAAVIENGHVAVDDSAELL